MKYKIWIHYRFDFESSSKFRDAIYIRQYGRLKIKAKYNAFFQTSRYQNFYDLLKARPGIIKELLEYEE